MVIPKNLMERNFRHELSNYDLVLHKHHGKDSYIVCDLHSGLLIAPTPYYGKYSGFSLMEALEWFENWKS